MSATDIWVTDMVVADIPLMGKSDVINKTGYCVMF